MRIVIAGGSGFLGRTLAHAWRNENHQVKVLTRRPGALAADDVRWNPGSGGAWTGVLERTDAVVNLAGEGIADRSWTVERKAAILSSRITATRALSEAIRACAHPPRIFVSASGIGFYGTPGDQLLTEESAPGSDFLATVCQSWERETSAAVGVARIVLLRTGVVLSRDGGALPRMALPFEFFAGGRLGSGRQYVSWVHLKDWAEMVRWALNSNHVSGPLNVTSPNPVTNAEFTAALAAAMHRPALFAVPAFVLRGMLGREMADALLLQGQRALPRKAETLGFRFRYPTVDAALNAIFA
ncbi:MAG: TIGR01777 family oxidoreductase [Vicinamibacterales bacterium]